MYGTVARTRVKPKNREALRAVFQKQRYSDFEGFVASYVLFENAGAVSPLNHLGVEVASTADVLAATRRFTDAGLAHTTAEVDACCHAVQDKAWVEAPDVPLGAWEFYTVLDDDATTEQASTGACCATGPADAIPCCASSAQDA